MKIKKSQLKRILSEAASEAMIQKYVTEHMLGMDQEGKFRMLVQQGMAPEEAIRKVASEDMFDEDDYDEFLESCELELDYEAIEKEALRGDDIMEQTNLAMQEIERQLIDSGLI